MLLRCILLCSLICCRGTWTAVGPAAAVLGGYKGVSVKVLPRHRAEGCKMTQRGIQLLGVLLMLSELALAPLQQQAFIPLGPVLQCSRLSSFEITVLSIEIVQAQIRVFPCKGCTVLTDYPDSLDSNYWSHLMGLFRNAAFCSMMEILSASSYAGGGAADSPACQDHAQRAISWLGLCMYPLTAGGLCFIPATRNISTFLPFWFPGRGMCESILIPPFNLHLKGFHQSCFQLMLLLFRSRASY